MSAGPELSSITSALEGLNQRITALAESLHGTERDDLGAALFEVERSLDTALRRLDKIVSALT